MHLISGFICSSQQKRHQEIYIFWTGKINPESKQKNVASILVLNYPQSVQKHVIMHVLLRNTEPFSPCLPDVHLDKEHISQHMTPDYRTPNVHVWIQEAAAKNWHRTRRVNELSLHSWNCISPAQPWKTVIGLMYYGARQKTSMFRFWAF